jgi:hypothetical protein
MAGSTTTGRGAGASNKATTKELANLVNGPTFVLAGVMASSGDEELMSPPSNPTGTVLFPKPLTGPSSNYVVMLTTKNGGWAYVTSMTNSNNKFSGFNFITENECDTMYLVVKIGSVGTDI